ncbi:MAG: hypothetical protein OHK0031_16730 [Anaerolineales bacterium]
MECSNCGAYNDDKNKVCEACGQALPAAAIVGKPEKASAAEKVKKSASAQPAPPPPAQLYQPVPVTPASLTWGPFAGYGKRQSYGGWMVEGEAPRARALFSAVENRFKERYSPAAEVFVRAFTGAGQQGEVEARNYLVFRRGQAAVTLNIVPFGSDIFISSATFLKAPFSRLKLALGALAFLLALGWLIAFPAWLADWALNIQRGGLLPLLAHAANVFDLLIWLCLLTPLGLAALIGLWVVFGRGFFAWVNQADFGAPFRMAANEFQQDDLLATNKIVEQTLRASLKEVGLEPVQMTRIFPQ